MKHNVQYHKMSVTRAGGVLTCKCDNHFMLMPFFILTKIKQHVTFSLLANRFQNNLPMKTVMGTSHGDELFPLSRQSNQITFKSRAFYRNRRPIIMCTKVCFRTLYHKPHESNSRPQTSQCSISTLILTSHRITQHFPITTEL
jgi:hypothetical protein